MKTLSQRFWEKVELAPAKACWLWFGATARVGRMTGYGRFNVNGKIIGAHVFAYTETIGEMPTGTEALLERTYAQSTRVRHIARKDTSTPQRIHGLAVLEEGFAGRVCAPLTENGIAK